MLGPRLKPKVEELGPYWVPCCHGKGPALALTARHPLLFNRVCCTSWPNLADETIVSGTIKVAPPRAASFPVFLPALACPHGSGRAIDEERQRKWATSWQTLRQSILQASSHFVDLGSIASGRLWKALRLRPLYSDTYMASFVP